MIRSKEDYGYYMEADRIALGIEKRWPAIITHDIWRFQRLLRKIEYFKNCKMSIFWRPYHYYLWFRFHRQSLKMGFTIPPNVFGPGLSIAHRGTIVINGKASIGANCRIHTCVNIGTAAGHDDKAPKIGDDVYIGPGAKIFGDIIIANGIAIGANSVVNHSFTEPHITVGGIPALKISEKGSHNLLTHATDILAKKKHKVFALQE